MGVIMPTEYLIDVAYTLSSPTYTGAGEGQAGSTAQWTSVSGGTNYNAPPQNTVFDNNDDGDLDLSGDYWASTSFPFTGYTVEINGVDYPIFSIAGGLFLAVLRPVGETWTNADIPASSNAYAGDNFDLSNFCFLEGTGIATPTGEVNVETVQRGDMVLTADGREVPVLWVGRQTIKNSIWLSEKLAPVCISAGALGNHSDLYVSADHGMIVDGMVINAAALVNWDTIRFVSVDDMPDEYTYYHIETEDHDVILANGAAAETFVDAAGRAGFDNHDEYLELFGAERIVPTMPKPRISSPRLVPADIQRRLAGELPREKTG